MPEDGYLGRTIFSNTETADSMNRTYAYHKSRMVVCLAARSAEKLIYGPDGVGDGVWGDIQKATRRARKIVMRFGMGGEIGPMFVNRRRRISETLLEKVEKDVEALLKEAEREADALMEKHAIHVMNISMGLLVRGLVNSPDINIIFGVGMKGRIMSPQDLRQLGKSGVDAASFKTKGYVRSNYRINKCSFFRG
ncbi:ATP-dependent zinc metalloprotease FTSH 11 chloroplastic/mitochondrial-like, partial [Trifolium medium]|nr:ATP-dependent zinc metalloprotease FTSH 11 chloroplastic/mitochondrial-like [Trifolium medium]